MTARLWERLRGARHIAFFAALAGISALALILAGGQRESQPQGGRTALEARLEAILGEVDGVEDVRVMITQDEAGETIGVVVVAERLRDMRAYLDVQSAVRTLLDARLDQIRIIGRPGSEDRQ